MMIWQYLIPTADGDVRNAYGCPVTVQVPGVGEVTAIYQFQGGEGDQQCAVVHLASGRSMAPVHDHHTGYPQQRAQAAVDERFRRIAFPSDAWHRATEACETLNTLPSVVGVLR